MPIFCSCVKCKSELATSQLTNHYNSKACNSGGKYKPLISCPYCLKLKEELTDENFANHVKNCLLNDKRLRYKNAKGFKYPNERKAWNKGLTCESDERVKKNTEAVALAKKNAPIVGCAAWSSEKRSLAAKLRGFGGYRPNAGRSKKFKVIDSFGKETTLQSTYELKCSQILDDLKIKWVRPKALKYEGRNYFADFYLTDYNIYLDPKNDYKAKIDADKINKVITENNVKLFVLLKEQITKEYIGRLTEMD